MKILLLTTLALLTLTGCASSAASKVIKALGNDPATVSVRVNGWGTVIEVSRANPVIGMNSTVATDGSLHVTTQDAKGVPGTVAAPQRAVAPANATSPRPVSRPVHPRPRPTTPATPAPAPAPSPVVK
jgi:hypothetical protein